jgi:hypothetical protein
MMTLSMYQASVPVFDRQLGAMANILEKGAAYADAHRIDPSILIGSRLYPDMFALGRQVQIASDAAKGAIARLAGADVPSWEDTETTFDQLRDRCARTRAFIAGFKAGQIDGSEEREIVLAMRAGSMTFTGQQYLLAFALPNFYFHVSMTYAILRHNGVEVGKRDFLGS